MESNYNIELYEFSGEIAFKLFLLFLSCGDGVLRPLIAVFYAVFSKSPKRGQAPPSPGGQAPPSPGGQVPPSSFSGDAVFVL